MQLNSQHATPNSSTEALAQVDTIYNEVFAGFMNKLFEKKSRVEVCSTVEVTDEWGRVVQVFYRVIDACDNAQTDESSDLYSIEQVLYKKRRVWLTSAGERVLLEWLYRVNPAGICD